MINQFFKRIGSFFSEAFNWVRRNWRLTSAIMLGIATALTVGLLVAFFPPALAFIAGLSFFGVAPFAALTSMSIIAASFASAGIAAATMFALTALFNVVYSCTKWLDQKITPAEAESSLSEANDDNEEDYLFHRTTNSNTTMREGLASGNATSLESAFSANAHDYNGGEQHQHPCSKKVTEVGLKNDTSDSSPIMSV